MPIAHLPEDVRPSSCSNLNQGTRLSSEVGIFCLRWGTVVFALRLSPPSSLSSALSAVVCLLVGKGAGPEAGTLRLRDDFGVVGLARKGPVLETDTRRLKKRL
jgi:hypothetical protein